MLLATHTHVLYIVPSRHSTAPRLLGFCRKTETDTILLAQATMAPEIPAHHTGVSSHWTSTAPTGVSFLPFPSLSFPVHMPMPTTAEPEVSRLKNKSTKPTTQQPWLSLASTPLDPCSPSATRLPTSLAPEVSIQEGRKVEVERRRR